MAVTTAVLLPGLDGTGDLFEPLIAAAPREIHTVVVDYPTSKTSLDVLEGLVWDNAPSHRDADITDLDLAFVGLPPYSPELNPAERLFEEIRRHVEGRVYATLDDKAADVQAFLEALDADPVRVRHLCGWDWITTAIATLPAPLANAA